MKAKLLAVVLLVAASTACFGQTAAQTPDDRLRAAESALERNDLKTAAALLSTLAEERPRDAHIQYDFGFAEEGVGDDRAAKHAYTAALAADPGYGEAHIALGLLLARSGETQAEAVNHLRTGANSQNTPAEARGQAFRALATLETAKEPAQADDDLLQAVKLTHETEPDIVESADLAVASGDLSDAEQAYRRALGVRPDDAAAAVGLARVLRREKKLPDAEATLLAAQKAHPGDPRVLSALAVVKAAEGKPGEAAALLEPLVPPGSAAQNPALARELARLYGGAQAWPKAEALYGELVRVQPNDPELLDAYADVLVHEAKFPQAEAILQRAVAEKAAWAKPEDWADAEGQLAFAASRNHDPQTTLQALAARATVLPISPASFFLEATAYDSLRQYKQASDAYKAFLQAAGGKFPDEEFEARHRLVALEHMK